MWAHIAGYENIQVVVWPGYELYPEMCNKNKGSWNSTAVAKTILGNNPQLYPIVISELHTGKLIVRIDKLVPASLTPSGSDMKLSA